VDATGADPADGADKNAADATQRDGEDSKGRNGGGGEAVVTAATTVASSNRLCHRATMRCA
jgi:hypothetical protein